MQPNRVKKILRSGGLALGTYTGGIADPQIVEIIGHAGYDAAFIDMEHTSFDLHNIQLMVMAAERMGITPIVRTPGFDPAFILRLLDMGVQGIQVPHISDARAAREAVKAVRYAPLGDRGRAGASRASEFGKIPLKEHMEQSNREITLAVMVEDLPAVQDIDAIASVEGVHLVADAVRKGGIARLALPMNHGALPRNAAELKELGVGYCNCAPSPEVRMLKSMQVQVAEARALLT